MARFDETTGERLDPEPTRKENPAPKPEQQPKTEPTKGDAPKGGK